MPQTPEPRTANGRTRFPRFEASSTDWVVLAFAGLGFFVGVDAALDFNPQAGRNVAFALGPFMLLAGLHPRLYAFLHARERRAWAHLPAPPSDHWAAASRTWVGALVLSGLVGALALAVATRLHAPYDFALTADWAWLVLHALLLERLAAAWSSRFGRRFPDTHPLRRAQENLGGGWTQPEAVVHLYAPAFAVAAATALAMPGQLAWERAVDGKGLEGIHLALALAPLATALVMARSASAQYGQGFFESVAWLHEAERSLAGPPTGRKTPAWARMIPSPVVRLRVLSWWRQTPLASLRLLAVVLLPSVWLLRAATGDAPPQGAALALWVAVLWAWLAPLRRLGAHRDSWRALEHALPLASGPHMAAVPLSAWLTLSGPLWLSLLLGLCALRMGA